MYIKVLQKQYDIQLYKLPTDFLIKLFKLCAIKQYTVKHHFPNFSKSKTHLMIMVNPKQKFGIKCT